MSYLAFLKQMCCLRKLEEFTSCDGISLVEAFEEKYHMAGGYYILRCFTKLECLPNHMVESMGAVANGVRLLLWKHST